MKYCIIVDKAIGVYCKQKKLDCLLDPFKIIFYNYKAL